MTNPKSVFVPAVILILYAILLSGCAETPNYTEFRPEYSYSIILKGVSTNNAQVFFNHLKSNGDARHIEIIELTENYAECRAWTEHESGEMFGVITSLLERQGHHPKVSYSAEKFIVRGS